jgi:uncharacterized iron-regulated protein
MNSCTQVFLFLLLLSTLLFPSIGVTHPHIVQADKQTEVKSEDFLKDLTDAQVVILGELHDNVNHHRAQLSIIKALQATGKPLAIGLEMFRADSQASLDEWSGGEMSLAEFLPIYKSNWSMWQEYEDIFLYSRAEQIKLVGLNIQRELTGKIAKDGFKSLSDEQRQSLGNVQCQVDPEYADYMRKAIGGHGGHGLQYLFFCEAQLLWDTLMARNLADFIENNPDYQVVVLAGNAHAWKYGIPRQLLEQTDLSYRVVLPEVFGRIDRLSFDEDVADYLWLDVDENGWEL